MFASYEHVSGSGGLSFAATPLTPRDAGARYFRSPGNAPLSVLAGEGLGGRFRFWRGVSERRFMFSVYSREDCPAYDRAVLIGAVVETDGARRILFIADTGAFPEPVLERARAALARERGKVEFHIHLLAQSPGDRAALIDDLAPPPAFAPWLRNWSASHSSSLS